MPDTPDQPATPSMMPEPPAAQPLAATDVAGAAPALPDEPSSVGMPEDATSAGPAGPAESGSEPEAGNDAPAVADLASATPAATAAPAASAAPARPDLSPAACADLLKQQFPALFSGPPKPLKLRIQADINERAPGLFTKAALSAFFRRYTTSTAYLIALGKATSRFDLDGQPAGELSEEHRQLARDELTRRRQITREREQQVQAQQRSQAQAQHAEEAERQRAQQQERQTRLTLLRDFERTTLTMANFCVLKGLKPEALTPLLEQARKEAAEAPPPPPPRFDDRRGPMRPRHDGPRHDGPRRDAPRQDARPGGRPDQRSTARTEGPRDGRADGRPDGRPGSRPDARPQGRPAGPPRGDRRGGKPPGADGAT